MRGSRSLCGVVLTSSVSPRPGCRVREHVKKASCHNGDSDGLSDRLACSHPGDDYRDHARDQTHHKDSWKGVSKHDGLQAHGWIVRRQSRFGLLSRDTPDAPHDTPCRDLGRLHRRTCRARIRRHPYIRRDPRPRRKEVRQC